MSLGSLSANGGGSASGGGGGGGAPSGPAGGDLGGSYPNPTVVSGSNLASKTVPVGALANDGTVDGKYLKSAGGIWVPTQVAYSDLSGVPSSFTPSAHESSHLPGGSDALPWAGSILGFGLDASKPAAAASNAGLLWFSTDISGGTWYQSTGSTWQQRTKGLTAAPSAHAATHVPGGSDDIYAHFGDMSSARLETFPRYDLAGSGANSAGTAYFTYFTALSDLTASAFLALTASPANSSQTLVRLGLYTVDGSGNLALVVASADVHAGGTTNVGAGTTNQPAFQAANALFSIPFAVGSDLSSTLTSYSLTRGTRYAVGTLQVSGGTPLYGTLGSTGPGILMGQSPRMAGLKAGQTDLATSYTSGAIGNTTLSTPWFALS